jgi:hypothetical protein
MANESALDVPTIDLSQIAACGGVDWNKWGKALKKTGEYVAPLIPYGAGRPLMNKGAEVQGGVWGAGGMLAGAAGGPLGVALGGTGGYLAGYYGSLLGRDIPTK